MLRIPNVISGRVDYTDLAWLDNSKGLDRYRLNKGDVLIVRTNGNPEYVGRSAVYNPDRFQDCVFASYLIRLICNPATLRPEFLHEMLQSPDIRRAIRKQVKSSAGNYNLNTQGIGGLEIPVPSPAKQGELQCQVACLDSVIGATRESFEGLDKITVTFLNVAFGDGQP